MCQLNCVTPAPLLSLVEKMGKILPKGFPSDYQVLFANSGAEAIENSIKVARTVTGRQTIIVFQSEEQGNQRCACVQPD